MNIFTVLTLLLFVAPASAIIAIVVGIRKREQAAARFPFGESQRRPAGEALRLKLEAIDEKVTDIGLYMCGVAAFFAFMYASLKSPGWPEFVVAFGLCTICTAPLGVWFYFLARKRSNYRLGYLGERYVGELLSKLIGVGFHIYHDVPFEKPDGKKFNIDHVLVGPRGVFAIETKTHRKPINDKGKKDHEVEFNGRMLKWSGGFEDFDSVQQAMLNRNTLANWIRSSTGQSAPVRPILTIPGWYIKPLVPFTELYVLNPKQIYNYCACAPQELSPARVTAICHQLEQKCAINVV
jgi:hypothetical protein